jgi:hypothetical protein
MFDVINAVSMKFGRDLAHEIYSIYMHNALCNISAEMSTTGFIHVQKVVPMLLEPPVGWRAVEQCRGLSI